MHILELGIAYYVSHREVNGFYNLPPKIREDIRFGYWINLKLLQEKRSRSEKRGSRRFRRRRRRNGKGEVFHPRRLYHYYYIILLLSYNIIINI